MSFYYDFNLNVTTDFSIGSCHEKNEDGGGEEKIKIEENISHMEVVKQTKFTNYSFFVKCNVYVKLILKDKKGCRRFYDLMTQSKKLN